MDRTGLFELDMDGMVAKLDVLAASSKSCATGNCESLIGGEATPEVIEVLDLANAFAFAEAYGKL